MSAPVADTLIASAQRIAAQHGDMRDTRDIEILALRTIVRTLCAEVDRLQWPTPQPEGAIVVDIQAVRAQRGAPEEPRRA